MRSWIGPLAVSLVLMGCEKKPPETPQPEAAQPSKDVVAEQAKPSANMEQPAPATKDDPAQKFLDAAIAARGGMDKVKAAGSWTVESKGVYLGMPYTAINHRQPGKLRMDVLDPQGKSSMSMLFGLEECWSTMGPVVLPCSQEMQTAYRKMMAMDEAYQLWTLKQGDWQLELGKEKSDQKELDVLKVSSTKFDVQGSLVFDPDTHQVVSVRYKSAMMGKEGEFVTKLSDVREFCQTQMPYKMTTTFEGMPYIQEEMSKVTCQPPDAKLFERPSQVADGTIVEKTTEPMVLACSLHKGPYDAIGGSMMKLTQLMQKHGLMPMGPAMMTYLKAPPKVKKPAKFVTELCFPVPPKAPKKAAKKAELNIKNMKAKNVLSVYGLGDYGEKSHQLMETLFQEAKKRKLFPKGPMTQITYMKPGSVPPDQLVSEVLVTVRGGKKKKKSNK